MNRRPLIFLFSVITLFVFLFGVQFGKLQNKNENAPETTEEVPEKKPQADLKNFWNVWERVHEQYVDPSVLNKEELVYGAIRGMVAALEDPYTVYMTPQETIEFQNSLDGTLEGIGAELTIKDHQLTIVAVIKKAPAEKAGLKADDVILKIDGEVAADMTIYEAITRIRGKGGTEVKLLILRENGSIEPFEIKIVRDKIHLDSVIFEEKENKIFYIGVHQFTDRTMEEFNAIMKEIVLKEPKGFILDLRSNGGGYLDIAVEMLSEFIGGKKEAVLIERRAPKPHEKIYVGENPSLPDIPLAVLVNKASASASEIVAGAIQDHKRGIVIGETTFGKGSVQEVETLPDKSSLRITIARWLTPEGRSIDKVGITPDIQIPLTEEDLEKARDPQLEEALKYLKKGK